MNERVAEGIEHSVRYLASPEAMVARRAVPLRGRQHVPDPLHLRRRRRTGLALAGRSVVGARSPWLTAEWNSTCARIEALLDAGMVT